MATGTIILRPIADYDTGEVVWEIYPADLTEKYLAVNEEVCDEDATHITVSAKSDGSSLFYRWGFLLGGNIPDGKIEIVSAVIKAYARKDSGTSAGMGFDVLAGDETVTIARKSLPDTYGLMTYESEELLAMLNDYIELKGTLPSLTLIADTSMSAGSSKGSAVAALYISQLFMELNYTASFGLNIHRKVNGEWKQAQAAFKKVGGVWTEITEDECRAYMQGNLIAH